MKLGIILGIMSIFGNNKKHNDKFLKEIQNTIMMKFLSSIIPCLSSIFSIMTREAMFLVLLTVCNRLNMAENKASTLLLYSNN